MLIVTPFFAARYRLALFDDWWENFDSASKLYFPSMRVSSSQLVFRMSSTALVEVLEGPGRCG